MTDIQTPRTNSRRIVQAAVALMIGLGLAAPMAAPVHATELRAPMAKSKPTYHYSKRGGVTIIILDEDKRSRSTVPKPKPGAKAGARLPAPSSRIDRDDDNTRIIIKQSRRTGGTRSSGPKVIIVDKNRGNGCDGSGVCVIRP